MAPVTFICLQEAHKQKHSNGKESEGYMNKVRQEMSNAHILNIKTNTSVVSGLQCT